MANEVERYLDVHPFRPWDQNAWTERSAIIDERFHSTDVFFTPLIGSSLTMPSGVGWNDHWYKGGEIVPSHVNHTPIGRYQRMMGPIYVDTRQRRLQSRYRYAAKWQMDEMDEMVTRYGDDTPTFITRVLDAQLADQIVGINEKLSRDAIIDFSLFNFLTDGSAFALNTNDFSDITAGPDSQFNVDILEEVALRMSYRVEDTLHQWGNYAQPVPGSNFRGSVLVMVTTATYWQIWNSNAQQWMIDLRQLQDGRIINGGQVQYRNMTIVDTGHALVLWNAGNIGAQVAATSPIAWGDGAPDPDVAGVDGVWYTGQSDEPTHFVQCSEIRDGDFAAGDFVSIHIARTAEYGVARGCDPLDGRTMRDEVYSVDVANNRLTFRKPITEQYLDAFDYVGTSDNAAIAGQGYAFITSAQHIHPVFVIGAREMVQWVARNQATGEAMRYNRPTDNDVDFPSIHRVTANWFGEMNRWNLDVYEVFFAAAQFANRGAPEWS